MNDTKPAKKPGKPKKPKRPSDPKRGEELRQMVREDIEQHRELIKKIRQKMN